MCELWTLAVRDIIDRVIDVTSASSTDSDRPSDNLVTGLAKTVYIRWALGRPSRRRLFDVRATYSTRYSVVISTDIEKKSERESQNIDWCNK